MTKAEWMALCVELSVGLEEIASLCEPVTSEFQSFGEQIFVAHVTLLSACASLKGVSWLLLAGLASEAGVLVRKLVECELAMAAIATQWDTFQPMIEAEHQFSRASSRSLINKLEAIPKRFRAEAHGANVSENRGKINWEKIAQGSDTLTRYAAHKWFSANAVHFSWLSLKRFVKPHDDGSDRYKFVVNDHDADTVALFALEGCKSAIGLAKSYLSIIENETAYDRLKSLDLKFKSIGTVSTE